MLLVAGFVAFIVLDSPLGIAALVAGALIEVGELFFWTRFLRRYRVQTGAEGMVGRVGFVTAECPPDGVGQVRVHGALWRARCEESVGAGAGAEVRVTAVEGLTLTVEPTGRQGR